jgi:hypothetical protein
MMLRMRQASPPPRRAIAYERWGSRTWPPLTLGANWLVANSAYTLSPSTRGEGKILRSFADLVRLKKQRERPLPALLRGEGRDLHGAAPGRSRVRGGHLLSVVAQCDGPPRPCPSKGEGEENETETLPEDPSKHLRLNVGSPVPPHTPPYQQFSPPPPLRGRAGVGGDFGLRGACP